MGRGTCHPNESGDVVTQIPLSTMTSAATIAFYTQSDVLKAFQFHSELDRSTYTELNIQFQLFDDVSPVPRDLAAAVLLSIIKGLAQPSAYSKLSSFADDSSETRSENVSLSQPAPFMEGLHGLANNFVQFQRHHKSAGAAGSAPATLVQVAQHCSSLLNDQRQDSSLLIEMFRIFMKYHSIDERHATTNEKPICPETPGYLMPFQKLLSHAIGGICSNTQHCLQDLMDFEYLWSSSLLISNKNPVSPLFGIGDCDLDEDFNETPPESSGESKNENSKRQQSPLVFVATSVKQNTARELAWALSRTVFSSIDSTKDSIRDHDSKSYDRRDNIVKTAACIDLVIAAALATSLSSENEEPTVKRPRVDEAENTNRQTAQPEGNDSVVMCKMVGSAYRPGSNHDGDETMYEGSVTINPRLLRDKLKESLLSSAKELILAVTFKYDPITFDDIMNAAKDIASKTLPWFTDVQAIDAASGLIPYFVSHKARRKSLLRVKEMYNKYKMQILGCNNTLVPSNIHPNNEFALKMGWFIGKLQHITFMDTVGIFFQTNIPERKLLAPFAKQQSYGVCAIIYGGQQISRMSFLKFYGGENSTNCARVYEWTQHSIFTSGLKNPPMTRTQSTELNKWIVALSSLSSPLSVIKPSPRLLSHLGSSSTPSPHQKNGEPQLEKWNEVIVPEVNSFLRIVAEDCAPEGASIGIVSKLFNTSDLGVHTVPVTANNMPSKVLQLYYFALDGILQTEATHQNSTINPILTLNHKFHRSLLSLCYFCIHKATSNGFEHSMVQDIGDCPAVYYKLIDSFIESLRPGSESILHSNHVFALPRYIILLLRQLQKLLLGLIWMTSGRGEENSIDSSFMGMINNLRRNPSKWPLKSLQHLCPIRLQKVSTNSVIVGNDTTSSREEMLVDYVLRNLVAYTKRRISAMCSALAIPNFIAISDRVTMVFCIMLCHRTDLFHNRHPDQLMMCAFYSVCAKMGFAPDVTFQQIKDAYKEITKDFMLSRTIHKIIHRVKLREGLGNVVSLYNVSDSLIF